MAGMLNNNLDPPQMANQPRERCDTWPRPRMDVPNMRMGNLDTTHEERETMNLLDSTSMTVVTQDSVMWPRSEVDISGQTSQDATALEPFPEDYLNNLSPSAMNYGGMSNFLNTLDLPNADFANTTSHLTNLTTLKEETQQTDMLPQCTTDPGTYISSATTSDFSKSPPLTTVATSQSSTPSTSRTSSKAKSTRKNAWGNMSYADLITQAIESSPEKRLTLAQIYEWMVKNIPYFKDKGDSNSSAGWKNSIRHNLSLHAKFKRIQNEGTGKSSWWVVNYDAKIEKTPRRRAVSVDTAHAKSMNSKRLAAKKKADLLKKQKSLKVQGPGGGYGGENALGSSIGEMTEFRDRSASHASYMGGTYSTKRDVEPSYIGLNCGPQHRSFESLPESASLPIASKQGGQLHDTPRNPNCLPALESLSLSGDRGMDFSQMPQQEDNKSSVYLQIQSQTTNRKNRESVTSSPHLASLLKTDLKGSPMKKKVIPKLEPRFQVNGEREPMVLQDYSTVMPMRNPTQFETPMQGQNMNNAQDYSYSCPVMPLNDQYSQRQMQTEVSQQGQMNYVSQQQYPGNMVDSLAQQYPGQQDMMADFTDLDPNSLYNPTDTIDINTIWNDVSHMDFGNAEPVMGYSTSLPTADLGNYHMVNNNNNPMPSLQPRMHPDPDSFINHPGPGATSADMMMDGCRMNMNNAPFQHIQPGQTSSVGGSQNYNMS